MPKHCQKVYELIEDQLYYLHETKIQMMDHEMAEGILCNVLTQEDEMDYLVRGKIDEYIGFSARSCSKLFLLQYTVALPILQK